LYYERPEDYRKTPKSIFLKAHILNLSIDNIVTILEDMGECIRKANTFRYIPDYIGKPRWMEKNKNEDMD
jgi:hypothetical protein